MSPIDLRMLVPGLQLNPNDPFAKSLGGSETSALQLAAEFASRDHITTVFANVDRPGMWRRVNIVPAGNWTNTQHGIPCDLAIAQRTPQGFANRSAAKAQFLWVHDLLFARRKAELNGSLHSIDRILTVSEWQKCQYMRVASDLPDRLFCTIRNGIDLELIEAIRAAGIERDPKLILCCARPERGVDILVNLIFPTLLERMPDARLALAMYDVPNPQLEPFYQALQAKAASYGDRLEWHGALNKSDLYRLMHRAAVYAYPTPSPGDPSFAETSCISLMEAMACGLPIICSERGALPETLGDAGMLVPCPGMHAAEPESVEGFVTGIGDIILKPKLWHTFHEAGLKRSAPLGWGPVADMILREYHELLAEECADPVRLARHFIRRQDIEAANAVLKRNLNADLPKAAELATLRSDLSQRFAHTRSPEALATFYADNVGPGNDRIFQSLMARQPANYRAQPYPRFDQMVRNVERMLGRPAEPGPPNGHAKVRILDFGCSQGEGPIVFANRLHATVFGVDASPDEIARCRQLADKHADRPEDLTFAVVTEDQASWQAIRDDVAANGPFDVLVAAEVLEHLFDPVATMRTLLTFVRPNGVVVLTMPYGPWESSQPPGLRQHLREWDVADIRDVFAEKPHLAIERTPSMVCPQSGEILGTSIITFFADGKPIHEIDWERKLTTQRPRHTLSANLLCGGPTAQLTLPWCLDSIAAVADEIIIIDCGMTDEAKRIAAQYGAVTVPGPSPLEVGFSEPRNQAIEISTGDFVLMIDTDERLCSGDALWRYLRSNVYHCYATPQIHFAVDAKWDPDLPGRVFRRGPDVESGKVLQFFGLLHEHPEFAINEGAGRAVVLPDVVLAHVGYLNQVVRAERFARNLPMLYRDLTANPNRELGLLVACRDSLIQAKFTLFQKGIDVNQVGCATTNPEAQHLCTDVIKIWSQHFADKAHVMASAAIGHYHEACRMLGCDVVQDGDGFAVSRQGVGSGGLSPNSKFYASIEHFDRAMKAKLAAAITPLSGEGF